MTDDVVPVQFFQVAATLIPLMLLTVALQQAPLHTVRENGPVMYLLGSLVALAAAVLGLAGSLAALRFGSNPVRLGLTVVGLVVGLLHVLYGFALKIVEDTGLHGGARRGSLVLAFVVSVTVLSVALRVLLDG